jgi:hypothetical protein
MNSAPLLQDVLGSIRIAQPFFTSALYLGESSVSRPGERTPGTHWIGGRVGRKAGVNTVEKREISSTHRESNPGRPYRTYTE